MNNLKSIVLIILTIFLIFPALAGIGTNHCDTQANGDWNEANTWTNCGGTYPQTNDWVSITHAVSFNQSAFVGEFSISGAGDFDVAAGDYTLTVDSSNLDLSGVNVTLLGDLTIQVYNHDLTIGDINGDFDLTLNGDLDTIFEGTNSSTTNTSLKSLTTNSQGATIIKGIRNFTLSGDTESIFKNEVELGTLGNIRGQLSIDLTGLGGFTFDDTITSPGNREHSLELTSDTGDFTFKDTVSVGNITTNGTANTVMEGFEITAAAGEYNIGHMVFNGPVIISDDMLFEVGSFDGNITFSSTINDDGDANTESGVLINCPNTTSFEGAVGDINPLERIETNSDGATTVYENITVIDDIEFNDYTTIIGSLTISADVALFYNDLDIATGDFTVEIDDNITSGTTGVIRGSGNFIKDGFGEFQINAVHTITGNVVINSGLLNNVNASENVFPSVGVFSLASGSEASLSSSITDIFELTDGQSIVGSGYMKNKVDRQQNVNVSISPGFSPGQLTFDRLYVDEFATLTFELSGKAAGAEYDQIIIKQGIELEYDLENGTSLDVSFGFVPSLGDVFTIVDNQSDNAVGDTFKDLAENDEIIIGSITVKISYIGGTGNDVTLTVTQLPQTIYVDADATTGGDGTSWATAYNDLHDGLNSAVYGDQVWVAEGVYYPDVSGGDPLSTFNLINGVKLYGGFNATETELNQKDPLANLTIISGDLDDDDTNKTNGITTEYTDLVGTNTFHLITSLNSDDTTLIDGFTLTAGWASGMSSADQRGSVLLCDNNSFLKLNNLIIQGNRTENRNVIRACESEITQSSFINNFTTAVGTISSKSGSYTDVIFKGNVANGQGSLFYMGGGYLNLTRVKIIGNGGGSASVIRALNVTLDFNDVLMSGNKVANGIIDALGTTNGLLNNLTVVGNLNNNNGNNGIYAGIKSNINGVNPLEINNSIFWNNQNETGLGTVDANVGNIGIGIVTIASSIVQNTGGSTAWVSTTLIDGGGNLDLDPLLISSIYPNSAPTTDGDARLQSVSMAIDTGDNSLASSPTDLDGRVRVFNEIIDMGAYEYFDEGVFENGFE